MQEIKYGTYECDNRENWNGGPQKLKGCNRTENTNHRKETLMREIFQQYRFFLS